uniref:Uncharacterized protein n=1 Tax=Ditylenchus dipsaci TaxID=166011 RepID=A0A915ER27_9BILA
MARRTRINHAIPVTEGNDVQMMNIPAACQMYTDVTGREEMFLLSDSGRDDPDRYCWRTAMFPVQWWTCYERTRSGEDRTNNFAEAAHRRPQDALGVNHPTVVAFFRSQADTEES